MTILSTDSKTDKQTSGNLVGKIENYQQTVTHTVTNDSF